MYQCCSMQSYQSCAVAGSISQPFHVSCTFFYHNGRLGLAILSFLSHTIYTYMASIIIAKVHSLYSTHYSNNSNKQLFSYTLHQYIHCVFMMRSFLCRLPERTKKSILVYYHVHVHTQQGQLKLSHAESVVENPSQVMPNSR